jgi:vacuolar protein sorting-associated protein 45
MAFSLLQSTQDYVTKMLGINGMKSLILDNETTLMISTIYGQSQLIQREVYLIENLQVFANAANVKKSMEKENYHHLKALVFIRPSEKNFNALKSLLTSHKYKEYHFFFTAVVSDSFLQSLAQMDEFDYIRTVQEYYADYYVITEDLFSLHLPYARSLSRSQAYWSAPERDNFTRQIQGLSGVLLSLKKRPDIRYSAKSELTKLIGLELQRVITSENSLFSFRSNEDAPTLLLLLDRRDDPVTPLLLQWTYQAMVHELFTINENRVDFTQYAGANKSMAQIVLSPHLDNFYKQSMFLNYGDLGASVKQLVQDYQRKTKTNTKLDTIEDMQRFVENFPEFKALSGQTSKHVFIVSQLSDLIKSRGLFNVSEVEQDLACTQDLPTATEQVYKFLHDHRFSLEDKVRVVALFALRYENDKGTQLHEYIQILRSQVKSEEDNKLVSFVDELKNYAGASVRGGDLFNNSNFLKRMVSTAKSGLKGIDNIYTQHKPLISTHLDNLSKASLKTNIFPYIDGANTLSATPKSSNKTYKHVIIYMVGGCTYEELLAVEAFNANNPVGMKVMLGGSTIHNSKSFIADVLSATEQSNMS